MFELKETDQFERWERDLKDRKARAIIASRLLRLASGAFGDAMPVGEGVSELRIHYGPGYRIYFRKHGAEIILLLAGGDKSTQAKDIKLAKELSKFWSDL
ncbi:MAG: type II toxin-antitoxin system RelE/ParE family toxin [Parvularculaceae bacterium]|nr:type II toxin-antitoxin system RelE/ParE family toxin [Parvularculaceae bacterium]